MAPLRYAAKFDPFLSLDCARAWGANVAIWQPCTWSIKAEEFWQEHAHADNNSAHSNDLHIKYVVKMEAKKGRLALASMIRKEGLEIIPIP